MNTTAGAERKEGIRQTFAHNMHSLHNWAMFHPLSSRERIDESLRSKHPTLPEVEEEKSLVLRPIGFLGDPILGPLRATAIPVIPPLWIADTERNLITHESPMELPQNLRTVIEDCADIVLSKGINALSEMQRNQWYTYEEWYFKNNPPIRELSTTGEVEYHQIPKGGLVEVLRSLKPLRMAIGMMRLGEMFNADGLFKEAEKRIKGFLWDGLGTPTSDDTKDAKKASVLPLILQNGMPSLARALPDSVSGEQLLQLVHGDSTTDYLGKWLVDRQSEAIAADERIDIIKTASALLPVGIALTPAITSGIITAFQSGGQQVLEAFIHGLQYTGDSFGAVGLALVTALSAFNIAAGTPMKRFVTNLDLNQSLVDNAAFYDAEAVLRKQLKYAFVSDQDAWVDSTLLDVAERRHLSQRKYTTSHAMECNMISGQALFDLTRQEAKERVNAMFNLCGITVPAGMNVSDVLLEKINHKLLDVQLQPDMQAKALLNSIVPQDRLIPLSDFMLRSEAYTSGTKALSHLVGRNLEHEAIYFPDQSHAREAFDQIGGSRLLAVKDILKDHMRKLSVALPAAHRSAAFAGEALGITPKSGNLDDASYFGGARVNTGTAGQEIALATQYHKTQNKILIGSHDHDVAIVKIPKASGPLDQLASTYQFIASSSNPFGPIALWATDRDRMDQQGLVKEIEKSFASLFPADGGQISEGALDYALRLIASTKYYQIQAHHLEGLYPQLREDLQRAQINLQYFRSQMVNTLWNGFCLNSRSLLSTSNPIFTYALIKLVQEAPEYMTPDMFESLLSESGLKGSFTAPDSGVPTTWTTILDYMADSHVDPNSGLNKYGINPQEVQAVRKGITDKLIVDRAKDFLLHIYGFTNIRTKDMPANSNGSGYAAFNKVFDDAHTFLDKTVRVMSDAQLISLYDTITYEMVSVINRMNVYARSAHTNDNLAYQRKFERITEVAQLIVNEMQRRPDDKRQLKAALQRGIYYTTTSEPTKRQAAQSFTEFQAVFTREYQTAGGYAGVTNAPVR